MKIIKKESILTNQRDILDVFDAPNIVISDM